MRERDTIDDAAPVGDTGQVRRVLTESADDLRLDLAEQRLGKVEADVDTLKHYRLTLTGVDDRNGRLGRMDAAIQHIRDELLAGDAAARAAASKALEELRADAVTKSGLTRRAKLVLGVIASIVLGGAGDAVYQSHRASVDGAARIDERLHQHDTDIDRLYQFCRAPRPDPMHRSTDP
ncbi:MAG TPA: hypothetical protein VHE35_20985 [Kofleriaceae bacterium]|nr:hypothetical protein [Kofleriaceae bacterium]